MGVVGEGEGGEASESGRGALGEGEKGEADDSDKWDDGAGGEKEAGRVDAGLLRRARFSLRVVMKFWGSGGEKGTSWTAKQGK